MPDRTEEIERVINFVDAQEHLRAQRNSLAWALALSVLLNVALAMWAVTR